MPDEEICGLRNAWQATARQRAAGSPECPEPDRIWSAVSGEMDFPELGRLVDHTARCPACAEAWRLARELAPKAPDAAVPGAGLRGARWWSLAAALAAVAIGGSVLLRPPQPPVEPIALRDGGAPAIRSLLEDGMPLHASRFALRWAPGPPGTRYDVELVSARLDAIARARGLEQPSFRVPEAQLAALASGSQLFWRVEARLPDGTRARSATFSVRLER